MSIRDNVGTPRQIIVGGIPCDAHSDCDISQILHEWETEFIATSGKPLRKMIRVVQTAKNVDLAVNPDVADLIAAMAASPVDLPMGFVTAAAITYMGTGAVKCGEYSHANGKLTVEIMWSTKPTKV